MYIKSLQNFSVYKYPPERDSSNQISMASNNGSKEKSDTQRKEIWTCEKKGCKNQVSTRAQACVKKTGNAVFCRRCWANKEDFYLEIHLLRSQMCCARPYTNDMKDRSCDYPCAHCDDYYYQIARHFDKYQKN